ncbi:hypothetical protein BU25DRAFT_416353 [Macroventuria anomochaeta]|uniref:Uncharacterized protein n=1 Tax=Macroventuria anomochaeta TaxID=301207 RepID=A0ACB6RJI7_9PLEO|nr:uncharacterized protein BU25DRAFT_416353 [Macroventuria anomochaeta]KAF2621142.1 hypothetical protein BU25DRAFT_416353 [Macroventuria anomochaeta]
MLIQSLFVCVCLCYSVWRAFAKEDGKGEERFRYIFTGLCLICYPPIWLVQAFSALVLHLGGPYYDW